MPPEHLGRGVTGWAEPVLKVKSGTLNEEGLCGAVCQADRLEFLQ